MQHPNQFNGTEFQDEDILDFAVKMQGKIRKKLVILKIAVVAAALLLISIGIIIGKYVL